LASDAETNLYAQSISTAFSRGTNSTNVTYPSTSLSNQLKTVAKFISGGLQSKVYLVKIGGFDTHDIQVASNTTTHLGTHANLLTQVSEAIDAFITDLNNQNLGDDVIAVPFSEFGRKAGENGNLGTDHGEIAPMFVFGKSINPGVSGTNINLSEAVAANNFQVQTVQHDYRRVFSTILQDWFGTSNQTLDLTFYNNTTNQGYANNKVSNMIKTEFAVPSNCYSNTLLSTNDFGNRNDIVVYPNPIINNKTITIQANINGVSDLQVVDLTGKLIFNTQVDFKNNSTEINLDGISNGTYLIKLKNQDKLLTKKISIQ
jgi:hypothetical protein